MLLFIILFSLLGGIEVILKPRLSITTNYYIIWYGRQGRRDFIKFTKL